MAKLSIPSGEELLQNNFTTSPTKDDCHSWKKYSLFQKIEHDKACSQKLATDHNLIYLASTP